MAASPSVWTSRADSHPQAHVTLVAGRYGAGMGSTPSPRSGANAETSAGFADSVRTPRSAGIAGIVFAVLILFEMIVSRSHGFESGNAEWLSDPTAYQLGTIAVALVPFAGIAFLWFIGVVRSRIGDREDRLFATVFLGSGLLFVMTLFVAAAMLAGTARIYPDGASPDDPTVALANSLSAELVATFGLRMAGVFVASASSLGARTGAMPRWLVAIGFLTAVVLLLGSPLSPWLALIFPVWVLIFSIHTLVVGFDVPSRSDATQTS